MGMVAILVMWPWPFEQTCVPPSHWSSIWNLTLTGPVVSEEKMFKFKVWTTTDDGRRRKMEVYLSHKLTKWAFGSDELKTKKSRMDGKTWKQYTSSPLSPTTPPPPQAQFAGYNYCNYPKIWTVCVLSYGNVSKNADRMANSVDLDHTAPSGCKRKRSGHRNFPSVSHV